MSFSAQGGALKPCLRPFQLVLLLPIMDLSESFESPQGGVARRGALRSLDFFELALSSGPPPRSWDFHMLACSAGHHAARNRPDHAGPLDAVGAPVQDPRSSHRRGSPLSPRTSLPGRRLQLMPRSLRLAVVRRPGSFFLLLPLQPLPCRLPMGTRVAMIRRPASFFPLPR